MKIKTSELEGAALDWAVAQATRLDVDIHIGLPARWISFTGNLVAYQPSTDWNRCGPLIEELEITITQDNARDGWYAAQVIYLPDHDEWHYGETPRIAACRAIVAAKLGNEVDVPEELA